MPSSDRRVTTLDQVLELTVLLGDDLRRALADEGLTPARTHLLWVLRERGPSSQRVVAEALRVSARNVTGLVDGLEATGFVTREPHPTDRRATLVTLTERGARTVAAMERGQAELAEQLFGGLGDRRLAVFSNTLGEVLVNLRRVLDEAGGDGRG